MKQKGFRWFVVIATCLSLVLLVIAGCGRATTQGSTPQSPAESTSQDSDKKVTGEPKGKQEITLNFRLGPDTFDPQATTATSALRGISQIFDRLVSLDNELKPLPMLATQWELQDDSLSWVFKLRRNVKFHDDTEFNAQAVKFTFSRLFDPKTKSPSADQFSMIDSVEVLDDYTVKFVLKFPYAPFPRVLSLIPASIISPTAVDKYGEDFFKHPVGTGPFKLQSWEPGNKAVLIRNDKYWAGPPKLEKVTFTYIRDESARMAALLAGDVDIEETVPPSQVKVVENNPDLQLYRGPALMTEYVGFNTDKQPFNDKLVRSAVAHAIDMDQIIKHVFNGVGVRAIQPISKKIWGYNPEIKGYNYDLEKARDYLAQAGWKDTDGDGYVDKNGKRLKAELLVMNLTEITRMAEAIKASVKQVGIDLTVTVQDWTTYLANIQKGNMQMFVLGWAPATGDADDTLYSQFHSSNVGRLNRTRFVNKELDRLLEAQRVERDPDKRLELIHKAIELIAAEAPWIPTFTRENLMAVNKRVKGFGLHPSDYYLLLNDVYVVR